MTVVLDASAAVNIGCGTTEGLRLATALAELGEEIIAPELMMMECANAMWKYVHAGMVTHDAAWGIYRAIVELPEQYYTSNQVAYESFNEAVRKDHSAYDMAYFVLARRTGAAIATCDVQLQEICEAEGIRCI